MLPESVLGERDDVAAPGGGNGLVACLECLQERSGIAEMQPAAGATDTTIFSNPRTRLAQARKAVTSLSPGDLRGRANLTPFRPTGSRPRRLMSKKRVRALASRLFPHLMNTTRPVRLRPWADNDLWLLRRRNTVEMTAHLGGPESDAALLARHRRWTGMSSNAPHEGRVFRVESPAGDSVGTVSFTPKEYEREPMFEVGWGILPEYQRQGWATASVRALLDHLAALPPAHRRLAVHAFPRVANSASNAVCRAIGFTLIAETVHEYPPGQHHVSNNWRFTLP